MLASDVIQTKVVGDYTQVCTFKKKMRWFQHFSEKTGESVV
jgi:hypothetical protein